MATYAARLAALQTAIDDLIVNGQRVEYEGRSYQAADLGQLRQLESLYTARAARETNGGGIRARFATPS